LLFSILLTLKRERLSKTIEDLSRNEADRIKSSS
jgi:hypothetical protein